MTTIVAYQGDNYSVIAHDSRISDTDPNGFVAQVMTLKPGAGKVVKNGKYLLGAAGDLRAINILHHVFTPVSPPANATGIKLDKFMTTKFIPELRACFESQGYASPEREASDHMAEQGSLLIVSIHATIYIIDGSYSWMSDSGGLYALGTGAPYALGALKAMFPKKNVTASQAKALALKALGVAAHYDPHTSTPFYAHIQEQ